ncbi:MAG: helix-turn-helix transcriptional regulator, partial [Cyanobacteria bacterium]|nr:helix-turn-helix transcriptional regulator [Cyanobacteriota bacterium]
AWFLEKQTGISRANLSSIEKGRRSASDEVLKKLATVPELEISYGTLKAWKYIDAFSPEELHHLLSETQEVINQHSFSENLDLKPSTNSSK